MSKEYIEREEALRQIFLEAMGHNFDFNAEYREIYTSAKRAIKNILAADVMEVRHGRWEYVKRRYEAWTHRCSECGEIMTTQIGKQANYCHNCGAKMDKEEYNDEA